jgi:hypothetical protein
MMTLSDVYHLLQWLAVRPAVVFLLVILFIVVGLIALYIIQRISDA